jgi:lipopolysaccharide transport system ATP-binding protein
MGTKVELKNVYKEYPLYHSLFTGIKGFIFSPRKTVKSLKANRFRALNDISFKVEEGQTIGVIGRNGAGKSSLLGLIAGVIRPTSGSISINGHVSAMLELGAGFHPELSGRDNIILNGVLMGYKRSNILKKIDNIIEFTELGEFIEEPIRIYSSGMLAKLGFSIITQLDPDILLIDEVLAVGDKEFQKKCTNIISQFKKRGITIIFVSHNMDEVLSICDKVLWIDDHRIKMYDDASTVIDCYKNG